MFLLAAIGLSASLAVESAEAGSVRDRDVSTQREVAGQKPPGPSTGISQDEKANATFGLPGFVTPYGYPLPPYADGNNFATIHTGR